MITIAGILNQMNEKIMLVMQYHQRFLNVVGWRK